MLPPNVWIGLSNDAASYVIPEGRNTHDRGTCNDKVGPVATMKTDGESKGGDTKFFQKF
jgi:hypothetical protein